MKISFLCYSFECEKDGVADYVRQFSRNLIALGHECQVIALADRYVSSSTSALQGEELFEVVRIPAHLWLEGNVQVAEEALRRFSPDWVSLQMACYGYDRRGLLRTADSFRRLRHYGKQHLMFHELWIGESTGYGLKDRLLGWLQKRLLLRMTRLWAPAIIHTSNPVYRELLRRNGITAIELALPGNIPIHPIEREPARLWLLQTLGLNHSTAMPCFLAGVFGSIHPEWQDTQWVIRLRDHCLRTGHQLILIQIGRATHRGEAVWKALEQELLGQVPFRSLGQLSARDVSAALQALDLGIATSPWSLVGKSGSVAAMLEHGLPVLVTRNDFRLRNGSTPEPEAHPLLYRFDSRSMNELASIADVAAVPQPRSEMYLSFLHSLQHAA